MHLRQPRFTYCSCKRFTKNKEQTQKFKEKGDSRYIYQSEPDEVCFKHDTAHGDLTDYLEERLQINYYMIKLLILLKIRNKMDINADLLYWFINFLI